MTSGELQAIKRKLSFCIFNSPKYVKIHIGNCQFYRLENAHSTRDNGKHERKHLPSSLFHVHFHSWCITSTILQRNHLQANDIAIS